MFLIQTIKILFIRCALIAVVLLHFGVFGDFEAFSQPTFGLEIEFDVERFEELKTCWYQESSVLIVDNFDFRASSFKMYDIHFFSDVLSRAIEYPPELS